MAYIFMDESGCLGFNFDKPKTSKNFIITFLLIQNDNVLNKIVSKTFRCMPERKRKTHCGTLHCNKEDNKTRIKLLSQLKGKDLSVICICLNKKKVYTKLQDEKTILYNYVTNILLNRLIEKKIISVKEPIYLIASKRETNKFLNQNFKSYLENNIVKNHKLKLDVTIKTPSEVKGLQVVDFISWSIFRKYETGNCSFYNVIKDIILEENPLFGQF